MNEYPQATEIMQDLPTTYPHEVEMLEEFLNESREYPKEAIRLGDATDELGRLADFLVFFMREIGLKTKVYFGEEAHGNLYYHDHDQIHIISTNLLAGLHEVGHALYGDSELQASRYSTSLMLATSKMKYQIPLFNRHILSNAI